MLTPSFKPWALIRISSENQASADFLPGVTGSDVQVDVRFQYGPRIERPPTSTKMPS